MKYCSDVVSLFQVSVWASCLTALKSVEYISKWQPLVILWKINISVYGTLFSEINTSIDLIFNGD